MNVRQKAYLASGLGVLLAFPFLVAGIAFHPIFLVVGAGVQMFFQLISARQKCRVCGKSISNNPVRFLEKWFHLKLYVWTVRIPKHCTLCGADLEKQA
ncbi:MAG: hypothetical protein KatS3mg076_0098 [Candidatus Binatia bacterium]|nr:MAG: hypothetical protein KatS3mg076_0098 [Candidatus Binatia bacterium]